MAVNYSRLEIGKAGCERPPCYSPTTAHITVPDLSANRPPQVYMGKALSPHNNQKDYPSTLILCYFNCALIQPRFIQTLLKERITNKVVLLCKFSACPHFLTMSHKTVPASGRKKCCLHSVPLTSAWPVCSEHEKVLRSVGLCLTHLTSLFIIFGGKK